ncbi:DivIVA domain-containing protein [Micromonospora sp. NPDC020750]|uniref:DivIVA domain-containing protein n=1 Tax=unclassified Micromonospora TaxID=2617518 RepID=UPI0037A2ABEA
MRNPFRRLRRDSRPAGTAARHRQPEQGRPVGAGNTGRHYRSAAYRPVCAGRVRERQFTLVHRGLDPDEVSAFLHRVAENLAALTPELDRTRDENARIKQTLRDWQSRFAPRPHPVAPRPHPVAPRAYR